MAESPARRLLTDGRFLFALTVAAAVLTFLGPLAAYDVWWHVKAGSVILQSGHVPHTDPFSFTAQGQPWTYHSWLAGVVLAGVWSMGGTTGLVLFRALMMTGALMVGWALARRRGVAAGLAAAFVLAACLQLRVSSLARPFLFSFVLFSVFAYLLQAAIGSAPPEGHRPTARHWLWGPGGRLALLPPLTLLWANCHAGFLAGFLLLGAFGVGEMARLVALKAGRPYLRLLVREEEGARFRAMFGAGAVSLAASIVTPYGPGVLTYPFRLLGTVKLVHKIQEWQPTPLDGEYTVFWGLLCIGAIVLARSAWAIVRGGRLRQEAGQLVTDVLLFVGFGLMATRGIRHIAWLMLLAPSLLGYHLSVSPRLPESAARKLIYAVATVALALAVGGAPFTKGRAALFGVSEDHTPVKACDFIQSHSLIYRPFNCYAWGGYLIWRFWPQMHVFIDGRALLYGDPVIGQYLQISRGDPGWQGLLDGYGVRMLLLNHRTDPTAHFFGYRRWRCVYWDDLALIALRDDVAEGKGLPEFRLSNPAVFERSLKEAPAAQVLAELDDVLKRDPQCWTALSFRARCLVRLAEERPDQRAELLDRASEAAAGALSLEKRQAAPWRAVADVARALGRTEQAEKAQRKAREFAKRKP